MPTRQRVMVIASGKIGHSCISINGTDFHWPVVGMASHSSGHNSYTSFMLPYVTLFSLQHVPHNFSFFLPVVSFLLRFTMDKGENPYQLLDVPQNADYVIIKKAYRRLALAQHPDRGGDAKKFAKIANAYEILSDPKQRHNFDLQQRNGVKGYDPGAPTFTTTRDDYDPSKPDYVPTKQNDVKYYDEEDQDDDVQETWTTITTMKNGVPVTQTRKNKTYTRTTSGVKPTPKSTSQSTSHSFHMDPMELFRQQFPEGFKALNKSPNKKKKQTTMSGPPTTSMKNMNLNSTSSTANDEIMGMASGTRTVTHPNGQKEVITETVITRADGSTETKVESKMMGGPIKTTLSPTKKKIMTTTTTNSKTVSKPSSSTSSFSSPSGTKKIVSTKSPTKKSLTVNNTTGSGTTYQAPRMSLTNSSQPNKNRHIVIKNGKPVVVYGDE